MKKRFSHLGLCFFFILGGALHSINLGEFRDTPIIPRKTLVLYKADSGTIPVTPWMNFTDFPPGSAQPGYSNGATIFDTTLAGRETYAGWTSTGATTPSFPSLNRKAGFQVDFTLQIEREAHRSDNRSGFSLIVLGEDVRGIELAFWEDEIWAQSDPSTGGLFKHGEGMAFPTTDALKKYQLTITDKTYTLFADGVPILTGPIRDYSAFEGFPNPYRTPNFLFIGDDTTSAQARVRLEFLSITGTETAEPTGTVTSTSTVTITNTPLPAATPIPLPSIAPTPSPIPGGKGFEFCPSASFLLVLGFSFARRVKHHK